MLRLIRFVLFIVMAGAAGLSSHAQGNQFVQTVLVANSAAYNPQIVNPNMIDAWGIAVRPPGAGGHIWVDDAESGSSVEYIGDVNGVPCTRMG